MFDIYIVLHIDSYKKVEKYLKEHFKSDPRTTLRLVIVLEEETESANALKLMLSLQKEQAKIATLPKYELDLYKKLSKLSMDELGFDKEEILVMEGSALLDFPLQQILSEHYLTRSTLTSVVRELDLTQKPRFIVKDDGHEIFGYCDLPRESMSPCEAQSSNLKRLILKTDSHMADDLQVKLKRTLLRKISNLKVRTDLQTMGIYLMKHWVLRFMQAYEQDSEDRIEFSSLGTEFVSFVAKNQFKKGIVKHAPLGCTDESVHTIMNPQQALVKKDFVRCQVHILPKTSD